MIKPIKLAIDISEIYAIDDDEISVCMDLPYTHEFKNLILDIPIPRVHWSRSIIKNKFNNEGNFYKYLIKLLIK